jgi:uncharacterized protein (DUF58 family)
VVGAAVGVASERAAALRGLELAVTRRLDGLLQGDYQGLVRGLGTEPGDGRPYVPGDDVRRIDWSLTARMGETHVRDAIADRELTTWAVVDDSASMAFGSATCEKRDLAVAAVAAVGFLTARPGNRIGAVVVGSDSTDTSPPRGGQDGVRALLARLLSSPRPADGGGPADLPAALRRVGRVARRRGLVVVVSDFVGPLNWEGPLRALAARHQVLAAEVGDPRDAELPAVGFLALVDPETGRRLEVQTAKPRVREAFAAAATGKRADVAAAIRRAGADHMVLATDRDWVSDIVGYVATKRRTRQ